MGGIITPEEARQQNRLVTAAELKTLALELKHAIVLVCSLATILIEKGLMTPDDLKKYNIEYVPPEHLNNQNSVPVNANKP